MISGPDGHAFEGQYQPKDLEKSAEFIDDSKKRPAGAMSRNDTVSKLFYSMGEGDVDYQGEDESLPGFGVSRNKQRDAEDTNDAVYHTGSAIISSENS